MGSTLRRAAASSTPTPSALLPTSWQAVLTRWSLSLIHIFNLTCRNLVDSQCQGNVFRDCQSIQQVDTPQNLYDMPCNMFVAGFIEMCIRDRLMGGDVSIVALGIPYARIFLLFTPFFMCNYICLLYTSRILSALA